MMTLSFPLSSFFCALLFRSRDISIAESYPFGKGANTLTRVQQKKYEQKGAGYPWRVPCSLSVRARPERNRRYSVRLCCIMHRRARRLAQETFCRYKQARLAAFAKTV